MQPAHKDEPRQHQLGGRGAAFSTDNLERGSNCSTSSVMQPAHIAPYFLMRVWFLQLAHWPSRHSPIGSPFQ